MVSVYGGKAVEGDFRLQQHMLINLPSHLTIADWGKLLISEILQMLHARWVFRNVSLHDTQEGYLRVQQRQAVLREVDRLSLPEHCRYLLEIDFSSFENQPLAKQQSWMYAMKAAMKAGKWASTSEEL